jgi:phage-related protein
MADRQAACGSLARRGLGSAHPLAKRIARTLFAVDSGVMLLLHGFIKKTHATPGSDIALAEKRFKEWKHGEK